MSAAAPEVDAPTHVGRYELGKEIGRGGMARVYLGKLVGAVGFARPVAIKTLHPGLANDAAFVKMFIDEARLAAHVRHPNVVSVLDVVATDGALYLVMEHVPGATLSKLVARAREEGTPIPLPVVCALAVGTLGGLHAAHEAKGEDGMPLAIVHRDVSPQNVLVGIDGTPKLLDFGIAKATSRLQSTVEGQVKGKLAYMSPEQLSGKTVDRRSDVFSAGIMLWELVTGQRLFQRDDDGATITALLQNDVPAPSTLRADASPALDAVVLRCLARDPAARFTDADAVVLALQESERIASAREVAEWVTSTLPPEPTIEASAARGTETLPPVPAAALASESEPATSVEASAPKRGRLFMIVALALVGVGGVVALAFSRTPVAPPAPLAAPSLAAPSLAETAPAAATTPTTDLVTAAPSVTTTEASMPSASAAPAPHDAAHPHRAAGHSKPAPKPDCRVVNPDGTIGYRPECLR